MIFKFILFHVYFCLSKYKPYRAYVTCILLFSTLKKSSVVLSRNLARLNIYGCFDVSYIFAHPRATMDSDKNRVSGTGYDE